MSLLLADYETGNSRFLSRILCVDIITYISHAKIINRPYSSKIFSMTRLVMENLLAFFKYYSYFRQLTMVCAMAYKITKRQIRFMSSDFFYYDDVIFMESGYDPIINKCIADNLQAIKKLFYKYELNFFYMPCFDKDMDEIIAYRAPYLQPKTINNKRWKSDAFLGYLTRAERNMQLPPCLIAQDSDDIINAYIFSLGCESDILPCFEDFCSEIYYERWNSTAFASRLIEPIGPWPSPDETFESDIEDIMEDVRRKIDYLRYSGVSQWALEQLVKPELRLSRLVVTNDCRIILPDYNNMEIKMQPLVKSVYLLFLRHDGGILFKHLSDYRDELHQIYNKVRTCSAPPVGATNEQILNSIRLVADPLSNSINEKCTRIREAFISRFDDNMAKYYYVTGRRGEPKRITLPRNMIEVKW